VARLSKRDVERLWDEYDGDPVAALTTALRIVLDAPGSGFDDLLELAGFDPSRRSALADGDVAALDELAGELGELRRLEQP
jgi:hypothetical protein